MYLYPPNSERVSFDLEIWWFGGLAENKLAKPQIWCQKKAPGDKFIYLSVILVLFSF